MGKEINIKKATFLKSSSNHEDCPVVDFPEVAFVGRSNVGKSSLLNMLTDRKSLAKVSSTPGKTRLINHFMIDETWYLVDLPGYGWAKVSRKETAKWEEMVHDYFQYRENLAIVFVLIDIRHKPLSSDLEMIKWLGENGIPLSIIFTKTDKLSKNKKVQMLAAYKKTLLTIWEELPPIFETSVHLGQGKDEILKFIIGECV